GVRPGMVCHEFEPQRFGLAGDQLVPDSVETDPAGGALVNTGEKAYVESGAKRAVERQSTIFTAAARECIGTGKSHASRGMSAHISKPRKRPLDRYPGLSRLCCQWRVRRSVCSESARMIRRRSAGAHHGRHAA